MATVTLPSGQVLEDVTGPELDYYRGEAATVPGYQIDGIEVEAGQLAAVADAPPFPKVFEGEPQPQEEIDEALASVADAQQVEQLPDGEYVEADMTEKSHPGTGEPPVGTVAELGGPAVEVSNPPTKARARR